MASKLHPCDRALAAELCASFGSWAPWEPAAPRLRGALEGGLSNRSLLLQGSKDAYVLRIGCADAPPGVSREREAHFAAAAAERGLAPPLLLCKADRGLMITRHMGETPVAIADVESLAALLRSIHQLPAWGKPLNSAVQLERWQSLLTAGSPTLELLTGNAAGMARSCQLIQRNTRALVACHNDLLAANLRIWDGRLIALDWEYAAMGDAFFDLAVCASDSGMEQCAPDLLRHYLQRTPNAAEQEDFTAQRVVAAAITSCWYERQQPDTVGAFTARQRLQSLLTEQNENRASP